jgi:hypothetical protein
MAKRDLYNLVGGGLSASGPVVSLQPAEVAATVYGTAADLQMYRSCLAIFSVGSWTDGTHTASLQHADTNSSASFSAVGSADLQGAFVAIASSATEDANQIQIVGYTGTKRYVRVIVTITSTTSGCIFGAALLRGHPRHHGIDLMD